MASPTRNGVRPSAIASATSMPVAAMSQGRPIAVDDEVAEEHRAERATDAPIPAELREAADERRGEDEPEQVATRRPEDELAVLDRWR